MSSIGSSLAGINRRMSNLVAQTQGMSAESAMLNRRVRECPRFHAGTRPGEVNIDTEITNIARTMQEVEDSVVQIHRTNRATHKLLLRTRAKAHNERAKAYNSRRENRNNLMALYNVWTNREVRNMPTGVVQVRSMTDPELDAILGELNASRRVSLSRNEGKDDILLNIITGDTYPGTPRYQHRKASRRF